MLGRVAKGGVATGDQALKERGRDGEGWRTLGGVEDAETAAGSGTNVEEATALGEAFGDGVDCGGDCGQFGRDRRSDGRVLVIDNGEHLQGGELIDVFRLRVT